MITQEIFKKQIGGIQTKLDARTVEPFFGFAERWFRAEIGRELFAYLDGLTNPIGADPDLLDLAQSCVAWHAYALAFPHLKLRVGDLGLMKSSPANTIAVTKWEYVDSRDANLSMTDLALENFWRELELVRPDAWTQSSAYQERNHYFLRSATELGKVLPIVGRNYRFFQKLLPYIDRAEEFYLAPAITESLFDTLKAKWQNPSSSFSAEEKELLKRIQKALAHYAVFEAFPYVPLIVDENGIRQARQKDGTQEEEYPEPHLRNSLRRQLHHDAESYLFRVKQYLDGKASPTVFTSYYEKYLAPEVVKSEPDDFTNQSHVIL